MSRFFDKYREYQEYQQQQRLKLLDDTTKTDLVPWEPDGGATRRPGVFIAECRRPARPANIESDFMVPVLQSVAVGSLVTTGGLYLSLFYGWLTWHLSCFIGLAAAGICFMAVLFWNRPLLWIVETVTHTDLDGDGHIGQPQPETATELIVNVKAEGGGVRQQYLSTLGVPPEKLQKFAGMVLSGRGLGVNAWTGRTGMFTRSEFDGLMGELERSGLVERANDAPNAARQLTETGKSAFEQLSWGEF